MSSVSLIYSNSKVCARYDGQNRRFSSFTTIDPTTRKACKKKSLEKFEFPEFLDYQVYGKLLVNFKILRTNRG